MDLLGGDRACRRVNVNAKILAAPPRIAAFA
jgi:hypothetical protein